MEEVAGSEYGVLEADHLTALATREASHSGSGWEQSSPLAPWLPVGLWAGFPRREGTRRMARLASPTVCHYCTAVGS